MFNSQQKMRNTAENWQESNIGIPVTLKNQSQGEETNYNLVEMERWLSG